MSAMTLEQVRDKLRRYAKDADTYFNRTRETLELTSAVLLADAIDAHITKVREVIAEMRAKGEAADVTVEDWADKLTAALQEKGNG